MKRAELIKATGYTENELIYMGLIKMKLWMRDNRNESHTDEHWAHYDALAKAYEALEEKYNAKLAKEGK